MIISVAHYIRILLLQQQFTQAEQLADMSHKINEMVFTMGTTPVNLMNRYLDMKDDMLDLLEYSLGPRRPPSMVLFTETEQALKVFLVNDQSHSAKWLTVAARELHETMLLLSRPSEHIDAAGQSAELNYLTFYLHNYQQDVKNLHHQALFELPPLLDDEIVWPEELSYHCEKMVFEWK